MGKQSSKTTTKTVYGNTTTSNPYFTSNTNNKGTVTNFVPGSAYETINNFVNNNMGSLLNEYLNPTLDSTTNKSKMNAFTKTLGNNTAKAVELWNVTSGNQTQDYVDISVTDGMTGHQWKDGSTQMTVKLTEKGLNIINGDGVTGNNKGGQGIGAGTSANSMSDMYMVLGQDGTQVYDLKKQKGERHKK